MTKNKVGLYDCHGIMLCREEVWEMIGGEATLLNYLLHDLNFRLGKIEDKTNATNKKRD